MFHLDQINSKIHGGLTSPFILRTLRIRQMKCYDFDVIQTLPCYSLAPIVDMGLSYAKRTQIVIY